MQLMSTPGSPRACELSWRAKRRARKTGLRRASAAHHSFGAVANAEHHAALHDERRRLKDEDADRPARSTGQARLSLPAYAHEEARRHVIGAIASHHGRVIAMESLCRRRLAEEQSSFACQVTPYMASPTPDNTKLACCGMVLLRGHSISQVEEAR